jgi:hypothetical protein
MTIPFGSLLLHVTVSFAPKRRTGWEENVALGMDDLELARLNQSNTRDPDFATWTGLRLSFGGGRRS